MQLQLQLQRLTDLVHVNPQAVVLRQLVESLELGLPPASRILREEVREVHLSRPNFAQEGGSAGEVRHEDSLLQTLLQRGVLRVSGVDTRVHDGHEALTMGVQCVDEFLHICRRKQLGVEGEVLCSAGEEAW